MTDTHATYEAMHREIKAGTNRDLARAVAEEAAKRGVVAPDEIDGFAAEVHKALLQATGETDEPPYNVVQGPW